MGLPKAQLLTGGVKAAVMTKNFVFAALKPEEEAGEEEQQAPCSGERKPQGGPPPGWVENFVLSKSSHQRPLFTQSRGLSRPCYVKFRQAARGSAARGAAAQPWVWGGEVKR